MWPTAIQNHLNAGLPMKHEWAFHAWPKRYSDNVEVAKGLWTGPYDHSITLGGIPRVYEGAMGALNISPIRYRMGAYIMEQSIDISLSPEGLELVKGHNSRMARCDLYCLCWDARNMAYLGERRFFKGFIDGAGGNFDQQGGVDTMPLRLVSQARKGTMTTTGKKSNASQHEIDPQDDFYRFADLGTVASDPWGAKHEPDDGSALWT